MSVRRVSSSRTKMAPMLAAVLPLQLVCQLVVPGAENFTPNSSANIAALNQSPSPKESTKLPEGYIAYPDIGMAYKIYDNAEVTAAAARKLCFDQGSQLALIDTPKKMEHVFSQTITERPVHVGIHKFDGSWVSSSDGSPVSSSIPWGTGEPEGNGNCVALYGAKSSVGTLYSYSCTDQRPYVCEIPIPKSDLTQ